MKKKNVFLAGLIVAFIFVLVIIIAINSKLPEPRGNIVNSADIEHIDNVDVEITTQLHKNEVPDGYVGIYTVDDFEYIRTNPSYNYILMNDLDFSGVMEWKAPDIESIFDGNNYTIKNFSSKEDADTYNWVSLFKRCSGIIQNLNLVDFNIDVNGKSDYACGSICSEAFASSDGAKSGIIGCNASGTINYSLTDKLLGGAGDYWSKANIDLDQFTFRIGGLVGEFCAPLGGTITVDDCSFNGKINIKCDYAKLIDYSLINSMNIYVGGISGLSCESNITKSKSAGDIILNISNSDTKFHDLGLMNSLMKIGGITGSIKGDSQISNSKNEINISSNCKNINIDAGGIVGYTDSFSAVTIREAFNLGNISLNTSHTNRAGGIVGDTYSYFPVMYNCYNAGNITAKEAGGMSGSSVAASGCYNVGTINGTEKSGALTADKSEHLEYSYYLNNGVDVTGDGGKYPYVKALSEEEMKNQSSFEWMNFNDVWTFSDGEYKYPVLINCP